VLRTLWLVGIGIHLRRIFYCSRQMSLRRSAMFCTDCHSRLFYRNLENRGWCESCKRIVDVSPCSVSYWCIAAVMLMPWLMPGGV
jgi:hypothetical protein